MTTATLDFDATAFRKALGCFPTGVAVITTTDASGQPVGLTCNSFSSVSLEPPLVLWSLRLGSKSIDIFRATQAFTINVLASGQARTSDRFASSSTPMADKFAGLSWQPGFGGSPVLDGCAARFECSVWHQHEAGDHVVFIGRVEHFDRAPDGHSLMFYRGAYQTLC